VPLHDHCPKTSAEAERPETVSRNARYGLVLFAVYLGLYAAFVLTSAFAPEVMERTPLAGVNLAILSGFGLIGSAFLLALIYGWLCRGEAAPQERSTENRR
jgi:uncharacterized membrane protein (DUF485 family)